MRQWVSVLASELRRGPRARDVPVWLASAWVSVLVRGELLAWVSVWVWGELLAWASRELASEQVSVSVSPPQPLAPTGEA